MDAFRCACHELNVLGETLNDLYKPWKASCHFEDRMGSDFRFRSAEEPRPARYPYLADEMGDLKPTPLPAEHRLGPSRSD